MNPYLERPGVWRDFHDGMLQKLRTYLTPQVRPRYFVRVQEHLYFREPPDPVGTLGAYADVGVSGTPEPVRGHGPTPAPATITLTLPVEEDPAVALEVFDRDGERLVTVLELLSPSNKYAGADREQYLGERRRLLRAGVNIVEVDLLRGGPRTLPDLPAGDYFAVVARPAEWPQAGVWPIRLGDRLPVIPIPLRTGDREPTVDLQAALHAVYDDAGYEDFIYRGDPEPALTPDQAAWAAGFVPPAAT
jgi:hypothetical protein